ncbi:hypothetical protein QTP88_025437 [Uroleucon formosanum]
MLKESLKAVKSHESNIKAGFKAAGIVPFNKEHVLRKVPVRQENEISSNDSVNSSWTEAFVSVLQDFRLNDSVPKKHKEFIEETEPETKPDPENNQPSTSKERTTYNKPEELDELNLGVIGMVYPIIDVNFLRKKNSYSGSSFFVYPHVPDKSRINAEQYVMKLKLSKKLKRDRYVFDLVVAEYVE